jgi:hypothetical protein
MFNRYLRLIVILITLLTAVLLLIHSQPYDDHGLNDLLKPADCSAPCFMGIQPGVTTQDEAIKLLQASAWVKHVETQTLNNMVGYITWTWSDQKPSWIDGREQGEIRAANQVVSNIMIYSDIPLGNTRLALGVPDAEMFDPGRTADGPILLYMAFYDQRGILVQNFQPCNLTEPLRSMVTLKISSVTSTQSFMQTLTRDHSLRDLYRAC